MCKMNYDGRLKRKAMWEGEAFHESAINGLQSFFEGALQDINA